jgi:hypothetical protein
MEADAVSKTPRFIKKQMMEKVHKEYYSIVRAL